MPAGNMSYPDLVSFYVTRHKVISSFRMRMSTFSILVVSLHFTAILSSAATARTDSTSPVEIRSGPVCANAPNTLAGTFVKPSFPHAITHS